MLMKFRVKLSDIGNVQHVVGCKCCVILKIDKDEYFRVTVKLYEYCSQCSERGYGFQDFSLKNQVTLMFTV